MPLICSEHKGAWDRHGPGFTSDPLTSPPRYIHQNARLTPLCKDIFCADTSMAMIASPPWWPMRGSSSVPHTRCCSLALRGPHLSAGSTQRLPHPAVEARSTATAVRRRPTASALHPKKDLHSRWRLTHGHGTGNESSRSRNPLGPKAQATGGSIPVKKRVDMNHVCT